MFGSIVTKLVIKTFGFGSISSQTINKSVVSVPICLIASSNVLNGSAGVPVAAPVEVESLG